MENNVKLAAEIVWKNIPIEKEKEKLIEKVMQKCFEVECIEPTSFYICVTLTNQEEIRQINKQYRNIDKPTDVLSFPMFEKQELEGILQKKQPITQDILGDIIICTSIVEQQAKEYEHSFERELSYMLVHGFYHLMGYDHMVEQEKIVMRQKEEKVLEELELTR